MPRLLKNYRQERGWSQSELGRKTGIHASTISLIESGRLVPSETHIAKIARAFRLERSDVVALMDEER